MCEQLWVPTRERIESSNMTRFSKWLQERTGLEFRHLSRTSQLEYYARRSVLAMLPGFQRCALVWRASAGSDERSDAADPMVSSIASQLCRGTTRGRFIRSRRRRPQRRSRRHPLPGLGRSEGAGQTSCRRPSTAGSWPGRPGLGLRFQCPGSGDRMPGNGVSRGSLEQRVTRLRTRRTGRPAEPG